MADVAPGGAVAVDLADCDREPIHIPGAIQPHGALLAVAEPALVTVVVSENVADITDVAVDTLLGAPIEQTLGADLADGVYRALQSGAPDQANPLTVAVGPHARPVEAVLHRSDGLLMIEVEPRQPSGGVGEMYRRLRVGLDRLHAARSLQALCDTLADVVQAVTGLDRVMVYRFADDDHGEVVAEAMGTDLPPYLGLHYPASDIPAQARALYVRNRLRVIARRDYEPAALVPNRNPLTGKPLDLSDAVLRSVSPIHLEYLRNMGVAASMSLSLVRGDRLWGLVACHHSTPIRLPFEHRAACELLAQLASTQLAVRHDRWAAVGRTPDEDAVRALIAALPPTEPGRPVATTALGTLVDDVDTGRIAGMLAVALAGATGSWLLWFRDEVIREVRWGGDPHKPVAVDGGGLRPRASFDEWRRQVGGHSAPWTAGDCAAAETLWRSLTEVIVDHSQRIEASNRDLARRNAELDAFAFTASHDLKAPLYGIAADVELLREDHADRLDGDGIGRLDAIERRVLRLTAQIEAVLEYSRLGHRDLTVSPVPLARVVDDVIETLAVQIDMQRATVTRTDVLPTVEGDEVMLGQLFENLIVNALTYTAADRPVVQVGRPTAEEWRELADAVEPEQLVVVVRDNGIGVPIDRREEIFTVFRRLPSSERYATGSGVGLATARRIAERHGGTIVVVDAATGGAAFCAILGENG